ncbi:hypothetical protein BDZ89DRAFT_1227227 [Hymenopellis radicata]|nr:hypothetical protein BDZ89DRAFT_1227227 [Hymenopellis radicata]
MNVFYNFHDLYASLCQTPGLAAALDMPKAMLFVRLAAGLKDEILLAQPARFNPLDVPATLPQHVTQFLSRALQISDDYVWGCWRSLGVVAWTLADEKDTEQRERRIFEDIGLDYDLSKYNLYPPHRHCQTPNSHATHYYCDKCRTAYYPDYSVHAGIRTYYETIPNYIQVAEHHYIQRETINLFIGLMQISWTSATNGARIYNEYLSRPEERPVHPNWPPERSFKLRTEHVWDAFLILSLLEDQLEHDSLSLSVPDTGDQSKRFTDAVRARNDRMRKTGQPEYAHFCDKCLHVSTDENGVVQKLHILVIDGITLGFFCCGVFGCDEPLPNQCALFCAAHADHIKICAVAGCEAAVQEGWRTCQNSEHRHLEEKYKQRDGAMFRLKVIMERSRVSHPDDAFGASAEETEATDCPANKDENETFYASESVSQTWDMIKRSFSPDFMPDIIFYDNNCRLFKHLRKSEKNPFWQRILSRIGFPVDVFHWKTKHKKTDVECSFHCNPYEFEELLTEDGKWAFNSSAAEQMNVWLGGFHAILREMGVHRFHFFLDEMIMRKNKSTVAKLKADGACPGRVPNVKLPQ